MKTIIVFLSIFIAGCGRHARTVTPLPWEGLSLSEMRAEHDRMRAQWWHDCIAPPPDVVRDNQPLCNHEIQEMTPLGNAIAVREMQMQAKR